MNDSKCQHEMQLKTIIFDMYGVIIKESKGNFIPFVKERLPQTDRKFFISQFNRAGIGEISSKEFLQSIGFPDWEEKQEEYLTKYLTFDEGFRVIAERLKGKIRMALASNDVSEWSVFLRKQYRIDQYFDEKIVSGEIGYRKPQRELFDITVSRLHCRPEECLLVDNSVRYLRAAEEVGIRTVLFNRDGEQYDGNTVYSFEELSEFFINSIENI